MERVAACMWRLRRLYRVEAGIFNYEIVTLEADNASKEVAKYEIEDWRWQLGDSDPVHITDEMRHDRASTRLDKAQILVQEEAGTLGAAFRSDANSVSDRRRCSSQ